MPSEEEKEKYGFFSQIQKDRSKSIKYDDNMKHPISNIYLNDNNEEVEVTQICSDANGFNNKVFYDNINIGKVNKWIKAIYN